MRGAKVRQLGSGGFGGEAVGGAAYEGSDVVVTVVFLGGAVCDSGADRCSGDCGVDQGCYGGSGSVEAVSGCFVEKTLTLFSIQVRGLTIDIVAYDGPRTGLIRLPSAHLSSRTGGVIDARSSGSSERAMRRVRRRR